MTDDHGIKIFSSLLIIRISLGYFGDDYGFVYFRHLSELKLFSRKVAYV